MWLVCGVVCWGVVCGRCSYRCSVVCCFVGDVGSKKNLLVLCCLF